MVFGEWWKIPNVLRGDGKPSHRMKIYTEMNMEPERDRKSVCVYELCIVIIHHCERELDEKEIDNDIPMEYASDIKAWPQFPFILHQLKQWNFSPSRYLSWLPSFFWSKSM